MIPVFNIFLPILAIRIGADALQVGLVGGTANAVYAFMPFVIGRFSDRRESRKFFVLSALAILTTVSVLYAVASNPVMLIALRIVEGTAWSMFWPVIEAEITLDGMRDPRKSLSQFNAVWSGASALGPIIGSLATLLLSLHSAFLVTAGIILCALVSNLIQNSGRKYESPDEERAMQPPRAPDTNPPSTEGRANAEVKRRKSSRLSVMLASNALVAVSFGTLITFYGPYAQSVGVSIATIGAVTFIYGFMRFFFFFLTTRDSFRRAVLRDTTMSGVVFVATAVTCLSSLLFFTNGWVILVSLIVFSLVGISQTFVILISQVVTIAEARAERKGARAGLLESTTGMGASLGPIVGGAVSGQSLLNSFLVPGISFVGAMIVLTFYLALRRLPDA